jgi:hypothetical protein
MEFHLAQLNIAKMLYSLDDPAMKDFVDALEPINALADKSDGFIWRLTGYGENATSLRIYGDEFLLVNMSVWKNIDSLHQYVYQSDHVEILKRKKEWFSKMSAMYMAMWYVPEGHFPTIEEAEERLTYRREHGDTPFSFSFKKPFTALEAAGYPDHPQPTRHLP